VLEYAPNGDLLGLLRRVERFGGEAARFYTGQVVEALEYLHGHGILHRDVKPEVCFFIELMIGGGFCIDERIFRISF
jgi:serine/threonine protein kinase